MCLVGVDMRLCFCFCLGILSVSGITQTLPIKEEFTGNALNPNIWTTYNSDSSFSVQNGKLYYLTDVTSNGDNESVLILKNPISLEKSWEVSFLIHQGETPVINPTPNSANSAFRKSGLIFINPSDTNLWRSVKFIDEGINKLPFMTYESHFYLKSNQPTTNGGGTNLLTLYPWQSNSSYARTSKITATWTAPTLQLKVKIEDPENIPSPGVKGFQFVGFEAGDFFNDPVKERATNVVIGIVMKSAYQECSYVDNFSLEHVYVSEGMDINLLSSPTLALPLSAWDIDEIITQPKSDGSGFFKITPR